MVNITIIRKRYYPLTTIGELYINDKLFCYTLEDTVRPDNIKVKRFTAIPATVLMTRIRRSPSFNRLMVLLYNDTSKTKVVNGNVSFSWIYFHGGNTHGDTAGCILVGFNTKDDKVYNYAEEELFKIVEEEIENGGSVIVEIHNSPQNN